ncbi:MAG: hypothetical protein JST47_09190 [Bacteroidetes bacterium]|nr:hypothetical protein [Bacteroidota bacterium]
MKKYLRMMFTTEFNTAEAIAQIKEKNEDHKRHSVPAIIMQAFDKQYAGITHQPFSIVQRFALNASH